MTLPEPVCCIISDLKYDFIDREVARYTRPITVAKLPSLLALDGALVCTYILDPTSQPNHME